MNADKLKQYHALTAELLTESSNTFNPDSRTPDQTPEMVELHSALENSLIATHTALEQLYDAPELH